MRGGATNLIKTITPYNNNINNTNNNHNKIAETEVSKKNPSFSTTCNKFNNKIKHQVNSISSLRKYHWKGDKEQHPLAISEEELKENYFTRMKTSKNIQTKRHLSKETTFQINYEPSVEKTEKIINESENNPILSYINNLNQILSQQNTNLFASKGSVSSVTNLTENSNNNKNLLKSQLNLPQIVEQSKTTDSNDIQDHNSFIEKENITNDIYICSDNRVKRYKVLLEFINSNLKDINTLFMQSLTKNNNNNNTNSNSNNILNSNNISNYNSNNNKNNNINNNLIMHTTNCDTSRNKDNREYKEIAENQDNLLKIEPFNNLSLFRDPSLDKVDELNSLLTLLNCTKTKILGYNAAESNCDYNDQDFNEFNLKTANFNVNIKNSPIKVNPHLNLNFNDLISLAKNKKDHQNPSLAKTGLNVNCLPSEYLFNEKNYVSPNVHPERVFSPILKSNLHSKYNESDLRLSLKNCNERIDSLKGLEFGKFVSPILMKNLDGESVIAINSSFEDKDNISEATSIIDNDYYSEKNTDVDKTIEEKFSKQSKQILNNNINFKLAVRNQNLNHPKNAIIEFIKKPITINNDKVIQPVSNSNGINAIASIAINKQPLNTDTNTNRNKNNNSNRITSTINNAPITQTVAIDIEKENKQESKCLIF